MALDNISNLLSQDALNGDWEKLSSRIQNAIEEVNKLAAASKEITFNIQGDNLLAFTERMKSSENSIDSMKSSLSQVKESFNSLNIATDKYGSSLTALLPTYADIKAQININTDEIKKYKDGIKAAEQSINVFGASILKNKEVASQYNAIIKENQVNIAKLETTNKALQNELTIIASIEKDLLQTEIKLNLATKESTQSIVEKKLTLSQLSKELLLNAQMEQEAFDKEVQIRVNKRLLNQELNKEVRFQTGEYEENLRRQIEIEERVALANEEKANKIAQANDSEAISNKKLEESVLALGVAQDETSIQTAEYTVAIAEQNRINKATAILNNANIKSYQALGAELALLDIQIKKYSLDEVKSNEEAKSLIVRQNELTQALKEYDSILGVSTRSVGEYKNANSALSNTRQEMVALQLRWNELTVEEIERYEQLKIKAIELSNAQRIVNEETKTGASIYEQFGNIFERTGLRMAASFVWWTLIIGAATTLYEMWTKIDDATQIGIDRLKDYFDSYSQHQKEAEDASPKTIANIEFDRQKSARLVSDLEREVNKGDYQKGFNKYKELLNLYPLIFDAMDKEDFKRNALNDRMKKQIETMDLYNIRLKDKAKLEDLSRNAIQDSKTNENLQTSTKLDIVNKFREDATTDSGNPRFFGFKQGALESKDAFVERIKKLSNDEILKVLQSDFKGKSKEKDSSWYKSDIKFLVEKLNELQQEQDSNLNNVDTYNKALNKLQPAITDMEGNTKDKKGKKTSRGREASNPIEEQAKTAQYELTRQRILEYQEVNKKINDDEKLSLEERLKANQEYYYASYKLAELDKDRLQEIEETKIRNSIEKKIEFENKLKKVKSGNSGYKGIEAIQEISILNKNIKEEEERIKDSNTRIIALNEGLKFNITKIAQEQTKAISVIYKTNENDWLQTQKLDFAQQQQNTVQHFLNQELSLKDSLEKRKISRKTYNKEIEKIEKDSKAKLLQDEIDFNDSLLTSDKLTKEQSYQILERNIALKKQQLNVDTSSKKSKKNDFRITDPLVDMLAKSGISDEDLLARKKEFYDKSVELAKASYDAINTIRNNSFAQEQMQLQIKMQALQNANQLAIQQINAKVGFETTKTNELAKQNAQFAAQQNSNQQQQNNLALRKAKADKQAAESAIIANTGIAITKALAVVADPLTTAIGLAEIGIITATGAAQYAAAASTPLPQFYMGGVTETPYFSAGERGLEHIQTVDGQGYFTSETASIYHEKPGAVVTNNEGTIKMIQYAVDNVLSSKSPSINKNNNEDYLVRLVSREVSKIISDKFEDVGGEIVYSMIRSKQPIINIENKNNSRLTYNRK